MNAVRKILLVEDNRGDAFLITGMLTDLDQGYDVTTAETLDRAVALLDERRFDVVLLDLQLPDSSGIDTFRAIQARKPQVPVIVLTGISDEEFAAKAIALGAQDYLIKGRFEADLLSSSILYAVERKRALDELKRLSRRMELILESAGEGIFGIDAEGNHTFINRTAAAMLGYEAGELLGKNGHAIYHHSRPDGALYPAEDCPVSAALLDGAERTGEDLYWRKDGTSFPILFTSRPMFEDGRIIGAVVTFRDISERKQAEAAQAYLSAIVESAGTAIISLSKDENGIIRTWNRGAERVYGYPAAEVIGRSVSLLVPPDHSNDVPGILERVSRGEHIERYKTMRMRKDGARIHVSLDVSPIRDRTGRIIGASTIAHDITARKQAEDHIRRAKELSEALNRLNNVIHSSLDIDGIMRKVVVDAARALAVDGTSVGLFDGDSFAIRHLFNMPEEIRTRCCRPSEITGILHVRAVRDAVAFNDVATDRRVNSRFWTGFGVHSILIAPLLMRDRVVGALSFYCTSAARTFSEEHIDFARKLSASLALALQNAQLFQERAAMEEEMRHMAQHDALTGLPNRRLFTEILDVEIAQARRRRQKLAVLFLDLDGFKKVNDTLGHEAGDQLLRQAGARLRSLVRRSDTVARIGGDEFNIIMSDVPRPDDVADVAGKIVSAFEAPFSVDGHPLHVSASIGISIYPDDGTDIETLLRYADIALYHAKENGKNTYRFYDPSINRRSLERIRLESMLRRSIDRDELTVYYQPLVDIPSGRIVCAEALARWRHPEQGLLSPRDFIAAAEETGFISAIDEWVLQAACAQVKSWLEEGLPPVGVTVNLSGRQIQDPGLVERVSAVLKETRIRPDLLDLEITESTAMSNLEKTASVLRRLADLGVRISIDDFGTGYSSLNQLKRLPVERLKIDQSFIRDVCRDPDDRAIVRAVTAMAHTMKIRVVAEGVETEEQFRFLQSAGCDEMQGFFFSRPLPASRFCQLFPAGCGKQGSPARGSRLIA